MSLPLHPPPSTPPQFVIKQAQSLPKGSNWVANRSLGGKIVDYRDKI